MRTKSSAVMDKPTKREAEVLDFVRAYRRENGYSPALTEVAKHFNRSIPTVHQHIQSLGKKNLLSVDKGKKRSIITPQDYKSPLVDIPLLYINTADEPND